MKLLSKLRRMPKVTMLLVGFIIFSGVFLVKSPHVAAVACSTPLPTTLPYGKVTQSINVTTAGTYRVWSRIKASSATNNSYYLQVDTGCPIVVGDDTGIPTGAWTWVNYRDASRTSFINVDLSVGTHQLQYVGKEADVQLDRVILASDLTCVPTPLTGTGDNCANPDVTPPVVSINSPAAGTNPSVTRGTAVSITANARDNVGVTRVEFLVDGAVVGNLPGTTATTYTYSWATTSAAVGPHSLVVKAYDAAGNVTPSTASSVTVTPSTTNQPPTVTMSTLQPTVPTGVSVTFAAMATDDVAVTKVEFYVDGVLIGSPDLAAPYNATWTATTPGVHSVMAKAYDAGPLVTQSVPVSVTVTSTVDNPYDVSGDDGKVNSRDYGMLVGHLGQDFTAADFDHSHTVDASDLAQLMQNWSF
jgi:hypothetical protein